MKNKLITVGISFFISIIGLAILNKLQVTNVTIDSTASLITILVSAVTLFVYSYIEKKS